MAWRPNVVTPLAVVLVHWDQPERCSATVAAFRAQGVPVTITVVDNGSTPEALAALRTALVDVEVVELGHNVGFGPAANVGFRRWLASGVGEWVALAPHDALPQPGCLERVLAAVSGHPRAGLACADVGDGEIPVVDPYFGGITLPARSAGSEEASTGDGWQLAGYPHGTLLFARRACLEDIGLFDERYFAYCEEADLGERARRAGWEVGIVRGADVRNPYLSGRSEVVDYLMLRNTLLLVRSQFGRYKAAMRFVIALLHLAHGTLRPSVRPLIFAPKARVQALTDHCLGRYGPPPATFLARKRAPDHGTIVPRSEPGGRRAGEEQGGGVPPSGRA